MRWARVERGALAQVLGLHLRQGVRRRRARDGLLAVTGDPVNVEIHVVSHHDAPCRRRRCYVPRAPPPRRCRNASKQMTAQATPTFSDSACPAMGTATLPAERGAQVRIEPRRLVAQEQGRGDGPVEVGVVLAVKYDGGKRAEARGSELLADAVRVLPHGERHVEQRPGGGAHRLGVVGVDRFACEDHRRRARGVRCSEDRARVPRVTHVGEDDDERARRGRPRPGLRGWLVEHGHHGDHGLGRDRVGHAFENARRQGEHPGPGGACPLADLLGGAIVVPGRRHVDGLDGTAGVERTADELGTLGHEGALGPASRALLQQPAQPADPPVREGQPLGQEATSAIGAFERAACAVATSAPNASGSLTARSARTLRSTSTPARCRPLTRRL